MNPDDPEILREAKCHLYEKQKPSNDAVILGEMTRA
jgi:hypothetical protein